MDAAARPTLAHAAYPGTVSRELPSSPAPSAEAPAELVLDGQAAARERRLGGIFAFTAYLIWGFLPLYFLLLKPTGPWA